LTAARKLKAQSFGAARSIAFKTRTKKLAIVMNRQTNA
jgi:hypothetical protein